MNVATAPSAKFARAAYSEVARVEYDRETLETRLEKLDDERRRVRQQITALQAREEALKVALCEADATRCGIKAVRGAQLRKEAVRVLYEARGSQPTHYRDWYELFVNSGYVVLCVGHPLPTFLTAITRSMLVNRAPQPGTYFVDPQRMGAVQQKLDEWRAELAEVEGVIAREVNPSEDLRKRRAALMATVRRYRRWVAEAKHCLGTT
jgi:hypothetical protein